MDLNVHIKQIADTMKRLRAGRDMFHRYQQLGAIGESTLALSITELKATGQALKADVDTLNDAIEGLTENQNGESGLVEEP